MSGSGSCNHRVHPSTFHRLQAQRPQLSTPQGLSQACTCPSSLLGATIQKLAEHQALCLSAPWVPWHYAREHTCTHLGMRVHVCVRKQGFQQRHQPGQSCRSCPGRARQELHGHGHSASRGCSLSSPSAWPWRQRMATVPTSVIISSPSLCASSPPSPWLRSTAPVTPESLSPAPRGHSALPSVRWGPPHWPRVLQEGRGIHFYPQEPRLLNTPRHTHPTCLQYLISP